MNDENLIPNSERTPSELREITSKGGRASGAARRKKKALKDCMKQLLDMPVTDVDQWNELAAMGIPIEDIDNKMLIAVRLFKSAADRNVKAFHELNCLIGENETDLDRKIKRAQLEKIKAETEAVKKSGSDKTDTELNINIDYGGDS